MQAKSQRMSVLFFCGPVLNKLFPPVCCLTDKRVHFRFHCAVLLTFHALPFVIWNRRGGNNLFSMLAEKRKQVISPQPSSLYSQLLRVESFFSPIVNWSSSHIFLFASLESAVCSHNVVCSFTSKMSLKASQFASPRIRGGNSCSDGGISLWELNS